MSKLCNLPREDVAKVLRTAVDVVTRVLAAGGDVRIRGFGNFRPRHLPAAVRRNPSTGKEMRIPPRRSVAFRASHALRSRMNEGS